MPTPSLRNTTPAATEAAKRGPLATPAEVAAYLGVPVKTLYQWKYRGSAPTCTRSAVTCATAGARWTPG